MAIIKHTNKDVYGVSLLGFTLSIDGSSDFYFDSHTNPTLAASINADVTAYRVTNGTLTRDGEPVAINPPCEDCQTISSISTASTVEDLRKIVQLLIEKPGFQKG